MKNKWKSLHVEDTLLQSKEFEDFAGIEELSDYEVVYDNGESSRTNKKKNLKVDNAPKIIKGENEDSESSRKKRKRKRKKNVKVVDAPKITKDIENSESSGIKRKKKKNTKANKKKKVEMELDSPDTVEGDIDMTDWENFLLPEEILQALRELKFTAPTPIQSLVIPTAIRDYKDIIGAAETGSGKTLAFGIPVICKILECKKGKDILDQEKPLYTLILTPTRELAIQIKKHLQDVSKYTDIRISTVVGGMAPEKQRRLLKKCPEIVVATPGRLWELIEEGESHLSKIPFIKHLVLDEADRMLEKGHFAELHQILNFVNRNKSSKRQNFIFSATLTFVHDAPQRLLFKKKQPKMSQKLKLESLIKTIDMRQPKVIDLTKRTALVSQLTESQIICSNEEKDLYLYYFISVYPGRTIVFCNSIDCVRRLRTVLEYLNCNPLPLHASMHQKQRLKNLEKFASSKHATLLATDVAARGLDIKGIEHVIHYQVPRTAETYIHRSGRTARAQSEGLSLMLIEPQEGTFYKRIYKALNKDKPLATFPIDQNIFKVLKERVTLARAIDKLEHRIKRLSAQNRWILNAAKEVDVDIEDEDLLNDLGSEEEHAAKLREINNLKKRLTCLLQKKIVAKINTGSYPTKNGKLCLLSAGSEKAIQVLKKVHKSNKKKL